MQKILISACLLGELVRYNGLPLSVDSDIFNRWVKSGRVIPFCPEVRGGLPIPREPAEIVKGDGLAVIKGTARVIQTGGKDVTPAFLTGAQLALELCLQHCIHMAILTESSPSCGTTSIYNGAFSSTKTGGMGVTSALLKANGIKVFSQHSIEDAEEFLRTFNN